MTQDSCLYFANFKPQRKEMQFFTDDQATRNAVEGKYNCKAMCLPDFRVAHLTCLLTRSNKKNSSDLCDRREKSERKVCWQKLTSDPWRKTWADDPGMETTVGHVGMKHFRGERRVFPLHLSPLLGLVTPEKVFWVLLSSQPPACKQSWERQRWRWQRTGSRT